MYAARVRGIDAILMPFNCITINQLLSVYMYSFFVYTHYKQYIPILFRCRKYFNTYVYLMPEIILSFKHTYILPTQRYGDNNWEHFRPECAFVKFLRGAAIAFSFAIVTSECWKQLQLRFLLSVGMHVIAAYTRIRTEHEQISL